ncbi:hypothetical protein QBC36DRAFT_353429 [Triangularia setosa]|uniref:Chromo domain-containing protein n=1 Tax=Triangularia setosa TaxID=2587417 RepID=A0AAN6W9D9_9PEZI|nr:hypothetical protein QBC36DRAFT_353429 [Podospora setosa]
MFKNVAVESRPSRQEDDLAESDDDSISLTSTVPPDQDQEYVVETVLAERVDKYGIMRYLVQWDVTQFDPFWDSTWEPAKDLGDELRTQWAETKAKQEAGEMEPFDVDKHSKVQKRKACEQEKRHNRRNAKRARLGLPLTSHFPAPSLFSNYTSQDEDSSDEEASEGDEIVEVPALRSKTPKPRRTSSASIQKKGIAQPISTNTSISPTLSKVNKDSQTSLAGRPTKPAAISDPQASSSTKKRQATGPSATGYGGPARKPSKDEINGLSKSKTKESNLGSRGAATSIRVASGQKTITARRSTQKTVQSKTGNIFTGGKVRKQRGTIEEAMSNPTKDPKPFSNMHIGRVAQLRSRAREDIAPDPSQVALFPLTEGPAAARRMSKDTGQPVDLPEEDSLFVASYTMGLHSEPQHITAPTPAKQTGLAPVLTGLLPKASTGLTPTSAGISPRSTGLPPSSTILPAGSVDTAPISRAPLKKRKSVRWDDHENSIVEFREPDPMDVDDNSPVESNQAVACSQSFAPRPHTPPPILPPPEPQVTPITQGTTSSRKRVTFGKAESDSNPLQTIFTSLPAEPQDEWFANFLAADNLEFDHSCLATAVATAFNSMVKNALAFGGVVPDTDKHSLDNVASCLRVGMLGLLCARPEYSVLIYPTKCEEWNQVQLKGVSASSKTHVAESELQYYIFVPHEDCLAMLPQPECAPSKSTGLGKELPNRQAILQKFFSFDHKRLLPPRPSPAHHFFLAFPDSKLEVRLLLFHWLRACSPNCCIFSSEVPGSWHAFQAKLNSEKASGVVIVHELLAWALHRIPNLRYHLFSQDDRWWCLTEPMNTLPMYPSMTSLLEDEFVAPGHLQLTRLFPCGTAILLTPSFLVSEPTRALEIIDWFLTYFAKSTTCRLVTAWDIATYLRNLATEKEQERAKLLASPMATESTASLAILENLRGLSKDDCESRFSAAAKAFELDDLRRRKIPPVGDNEESATLVYAINSIDPNDEQSLVNWFGYWSTLRMDQFRHFYVLGSDDAMTAHGSARGEREIPVPKYTEFTINDPDIVMKATLELYHDRNMHAEQPMGICRVDGAHMATAATAPAGVYQALATYEVQSECFTRVDMHSLAAMLRDLGPPEWKSSIWILYGFPVSWNDSEMSDHFQDFTQAYNTIPTWFNWGHSWGGKSGTWRYNTYVAFFYTVADEWDPSNKPHDRRPKRHPWLVFYRPRNAYRKPWEKAELIIWDPAAPRKFGDREPTEGELTFMQRQVIKYVREHGPEKNYSSELDSVWLGGYKIPDECCSLYDIDVVALFLQFIGHESKFREFVPAPSVVMEKPDSGYRRVRLSTELSREQVYDGEMGDVAMDIEKPGASDEEVVRIIFHPPRATGRPVSEAGPSKCRNRLFEEARLWCNKHGQRSQQMRYQFRPTTEWYKEQEEEGRGFSHMADSEPSIPPWPAWAEPSGSIGENAPKNQPSAQLQLSVYGQSPLAGLQTFINACDEQSSTPPLSLQEPPTRGLSTPVFTPLGMPIPMRLINKSSIPSKSILKNSGTPQPTAAMGEVQLPVSDFQTAPSNTAFSRMRISSPPLVSRVLKKTIPTETRASEEKASTVVSVVGYCEKLFRKPDPVSQESNVASEEEDSPSLIPAPEFYQLKKRRTSETSSILVKGDETPSSASKALSSKARTLPSLAKAPASKLKVASSQSKATTSQARASTLPARTPTSQPKTPTSLVKNPTPRPQMASPTTGSTSRRIKSAVPPSRKASTTATIPITPEEATTIPPLRPSETKWRKSFVAPSLSSSSTPAPKTTTFTGKTTGTKARPC